MRVFKVGDKVYHTRSGHNGIVETFEDNIGAVRVNGDVSPIETEGDWILLKSTKATDLVLLTQTFGRYYGNVVRRQLYDANIPWRNESVQAGRPDMINFYVSKSNLEKAKALLESYV
jgi:hypothetical protein